MIGNKKFVYMLDDREHYRIHKTGTSLFRLSKRYFGFM